MSAIASPDDIPARPDLDFPAQLADRDNDAAAIGYAPRYTHRPMTRAAFEAALAGLVDCGQQQEVA